MYTAVQRERLAFSVVYVCVLSGYKPGSTDAQIICFKCRLVCPQSSGSSVLAGSWCSNTVFFFDRLDELKRSIMLCTAVLPCFPV